MLHSGRLIGTAPKLLMASTKYLAPDFATNSPISLIGLIIPVVVSQCTTETVVILLSVVSVFSISKKIRYCVFGIFECDGFDFKH